VDNAFFAIKTPPLLKGFNNSLRNLMAPNDFLLIRPTLFGHYSHPEPTEGPICSEFGSVQSLAEK
jgi:hypothetical protein